MDHLSSRPVSEPGVKEVPWEGSTLNSARLQGEQSCGGPLPNQTSQPLSFLPALLWNPLLWPGPLACGISLSWSVIWAPVKLKPPGEMLGYHPGLCLRRGVWCGRQAGRQPHLQCGVTGLCPRAYGCSAGHMALYPGHGAKHFEVISGKWLAADIYHPPLLRK